MKYIADFVYDIKEELEGAKDYAEKSVYYKSQGNANRAKIYNEMATQELQHSKYLHDMVTEEINKIKEVYKPTNEMMKMWEEAHAEYVENFSWVKQMLAM